MDDFKVVGTLFFALFSVLFTCIGLLLYYDEPLPKRPPQPSHYKHLMQTQALLRLQTDPVTAPCRPCCKEGD